MNRRHTELRDELLAERRLTTEQYWASAEQRLDWPLARGLNLAHECCDRWAGDRGRVALTVYDAHGKLTRWTFHELTRASRALANAFVESGLSRGDRVVALIDQQVEAYICALAAWRAGLVYVPMFVGFGTHALVERIDGADASAVVVDRRYRDAFARARERLQVRPTVWTISGADGIGVARGDYSFWHEVRSHSTDFATVATAPSDCATLIYTSGTTGKPKGCLHPHSVLLPLQSFVRHVMALGCADVVFAGANPGWSYGLYTVGLAVQSLGVSRVVYAGQFEPSAWLDVMDQEAVTYLATAPSAFRQLVTLAAKRGLPTSIRGGLSAGEPLTATLTEQWNALGAGPLQDGYGSSEMGMVLANLAFEDRVVPPGALSSMVPGFDVVLVDHDGRPGGDHGIIGVRSVRWPILGYQGLDDLWASRTVGEVFLSGDVARRDEDGLYWFAGRDDDVIVTSGYNVGPAEVENIIAAIDGVAEVAVVAAPDPDRGSVVRAVVVSDGATDRTHISTEIQRRVKERLGRHAYPKIIDYVEALPRTEVGKIKRSAVRSVP